MTNTGKVISIAEMESAIMKSGYLLEQRVASSLQKAGYYATTNDAYPDPTTGISREIDVDAIAAYKTSRSGDYIFSRVLCECENNQYPVVFFVKDSISTPTNGDNIKCSGIPLHFVKCPTGDPLVDLYQETEPLPQYLNLNKFHHYCINPVATQYCSFNKKSETAPWVASHNEAQHNSINNLIFALESRIDEVYNHYTLPGDGQIEPTNIEIFYPIIVLQGEIYTGKMTKGKLTLKKEKHIRYIREFFSKSNRGTYVIDVVNEKYLPKLLAIIDKEMTEIQKRIKQKSRTVAISKEILVHKARKKDPDELFRAIFGCN